MWLPRKSSTNSCITQGSVNGGFQTVVRVLSGEQIPLPPFYLNLTPFLPQFYLILTSFLPFFNLNLTSAQPAISNHGLETTVYIPLDYHYFRNHYMFNSKTISLCNCNCNCRRIIPKTIFYVTVPNCNGKDIFPSDPQSCNCNGN